MLILDIKTGKPAWWHKYQIIAYQKLVEEGITDINFNEDKHIYSTKSGEKIPSVTQILKLIQEWDYLDSLPADRGTYIHKCCELYDTGLLDFDNLDEIDKDYVLKWRKFKIKNALGKANGEIIEQTYYSRKYKYAGKVDRIYFKHPLNELWLVYLHPDISEDKMLKKVKNSDELFNDFLCAKRTFELRRDKK